MAVSVSQEKLDLATIFKISEILFPDLAICSFISALVNMGIFSRDVLHPSVEYLTVRRSLLFASLYEESGNTRCSSNSNALLSSLGVQTIWIRIHDIFVLPSLDVLFYPDKGIG